MQKILFPYTKDTFCGSLDTEPVSCICIPDPNFEHNLDHHTQVLAVAGGRTSESPADILDSVETFDSSTGKFSPSANLTLEVPRSGHSTGFLRKEACRW